MADTKLVDITGDGMTIGKADADHLSIDSDGIALYAHGDKVFETGVYEPDKNIINRGTAEMKLPSVSDYNAVNNATATYVSARIDVSGTKDGGTIDVQYACDGDYAETLGDISFTGGTAATNVIVEDVLVFDYDGTGTIIVQETPGVYIFIRYDRPDKWANVKANGSISATRTVNADEGFTVNGVPYCPYPVGAVFFTTIDYEKSPSTIWLGTSWMQIESGRFLMSSGTGYQIWSTGGESAHKLTDDEMPRHSHSFTTDSAGSHAHTFTTDSAGSHAHTFTTDSAGSHAHTFTTDSAGAHTHKTGHKRADAYGGGNMDAMHYSGTFDVTSSSAGAHTHGGTTAGAGDHTHGGTTAGAGDHTHSGTTAAVGGAQSHNNMPPYIAVAIWIRIA